MYKKCARVCPIYKSEDKRKCENYRLISTYFCLVFSLRAGPRIGGNGGPTNKKPYFVKRPLFTTRPIHRSILKKEPITENNTHQNVAGFSLLIPSENIFYFTIFFYFFNLILRNRKLNIYRMESLQFKGLGTFMKFFQALY